ncbi:Na+/H+ antiporter NhaA [Nocardia sp. CC201C]|uniref:Na+/H+ antiporter NhaA n=1 Tax=Nocardia sp. CC201C TaxID=3044575 RepID=UPI0024A8272B|nr:Na+/H+ antiporter NhaA [Nocardia sp. CC201C]
MASNGGRDGSPREAATGSSVAASQPSTNLLFPIPPPPEDTRVAALLRRETVGGALVLAATVLALAWANSPWQDVYATVRDFTFGPHVAHLHLSVGEWAAGGLLAIFFFVAGLELKQEFVTGELSRFRRAILPVAAALGGMIVPALVYVAIIVSTGVDALRGWAIPSATDIAFAVAVLGLISTHLPPSLRTFLLTLAVVDDLIAITIIAVFYSGTLTPAYFGGALLALLAFAFVVRRWPRRWWLLLPLAIVTWAMVHGAGVHATVAGLLLGAVVPVRGGDRDPYPAQRLEERWRPVAAGLAVPVFALFAAGVSVSGLRGLTEALTDPVAIGIVAGLVLGKSFGIFGTTFAAARWTRARLDPGLRWIDVYGAALLAGIGFTVSLLISELAFGPGSPHAEHAKIGVLCGSLTAAVLAAVILRIRNRAYRRAEHEEEAEQEKQHE